MHDITKGVGYEVVANLDPLGFDEFALLLPKHNEQRDVGEINERYREMLARAESLSSLTGFEATACLRDLDIVAGSLLRHGAKELAETLGAQRGLARLGNIAGTVPRGTVFTYAAGNPDGDRRRTFTGSSGEELFIIAVKRGVGALDTAMDEIQSASQGDYQGLDNASRQMDTMVASIIEVRRGITPQFFTHEMRPYFDNLQVNGVAYAGAGGAQMQLIGVDRMVWGADSSDDEYQAYYKDNVRYLTPEQRRQINDFEVRTEGASIVTLIENGELPSVMASGALGLLRTMKKFRYPHRRVAQDNFAIRPDGAQGSGNYTPTILDSLIDWTEQAIRKMEAVRA